MTTRFDIPPRMLASAALKQFGADDSRLVDVRSGTNIVFATDDLIVRVGESSYDRELISRQQHMVAWLINAGFPTPPCFGQFEVFGHPVNVWERFRPVREPDHEDAGFLARMFHDLTDTYGGSLPMWEPVGPLSERLDTFEPDAVVDRAALDVLLRRKDALLEAAGSWEPVLPYGPLHGDIHLGNIIVSENGPALIDYDRICFGLREWDLVSAYAAYRLFGHPKQGWQNFSGAYGFDLTDWVHAENVLEMRALFMLSWLMNLDRTPQNVEEITRRLKYFTDREKGYPVWVGI